MRGPFADRVFRIVFAAAGCYNLAFGLWAAIWPLAFFRLFDIPLPRYPGIWACLGMVVGLYGFLYWHAAWKLESAWPIIAVGLLGKVLGPIGMVTSFGDDWPSRVGMICVFNDLIWWLPFGLFLVRGTQIGRRTTALAPWTCVVTHVVGLVFVVLFLQQGTAAEADIALRGQYVAKHSGLWTAGWAAWMASAASLVGFYAWWGGKLQADAATSSNGSPSRAKVAIAAVIVTAIGLVCDFAGESSLILLLGEHAPKLAAVDGPNSWEASEFLHIELAFIWLSAVAANSLYTLGGIMLTQLTPDLPRWVRAAMWITWLAGIGMTLAALFNSTNGIAIATGILFPPFLVWVAWMGRSWRRT
jgi:hypothetical protein